MADFLLELLSEEIPARMQDKAREDLARLFAAEIGKAGLKAEAIETCATPRRLVLIARGLPPETAAVREETKGPRASAPPQALDGFLRKTGLTREQLEERDGVLFAVVEKPGRPAASVLAEAILAMIRAFPWPRSMRWGEASASTESLRWVRPLQGIVALLGEEIVEFEIAGLRSGAATVGHRFHHTGPITIGGAGDYVEKLKACHVIVDQEERKRIVRDGAAALAAEAGLTLVEDEGLVAENAGLTEWPVPLLGCFDPAFLGVPGEVIQLTMRTNQKYFALTPLPAGERETRRSGEGEGTVSPAAGPHPGASRQVGVDRAPRDVGLPGASHPQLLSPAGRGALAPNFVCVANIEATDGGAAIVKGNERVLSARLADAKFFWEQDLKVPLEEQANKLRDIVFHEKLGTVADKVERVARLARWLVEEGIVRPSPLQGRGLGEGQSSR
jgi:glycyl-tRNA synthetase beta chain